MNLHIVNGPGVPDWSDPRYRGVRRAHPPYCDVLPPEHEVNRLFVDWYLVEAESDVVHDLDKAIHYAQVCNRHLPGQFFEVIESTDGNALARAGGRFLGYDLLFRNANSLLYWGLKAWPTKGRPPSAADALWKALSLCFGPKLNEFGLFKGIDDSLLCLGSMIALESFTPGYFQSGDLSEFHPMGIYLVWGQDKWPPVADGEAHRQTDINPRVAEAPTAPKE